MEESAVRDSEENKARQQFWTELTKVGLRAQGKLKRDELEDVAPHLVGRS